MSELVNAFIAVLPGMDPITTISLLALAAMIYAYNKLLNDRFTDLKESNDKSEALIKEITAVMAKFNSKE